MTFKFQVTDAVEIFKDPIGHYHHWTILAGRLVEGTMHLYDRICIPAVDGTMMVARIGGFDAYGMRFGSEVSSGQYADPFGVMVSSPAPSRREIAMDVATSASSREFHELVGWALRHRPARLLHDRGPEGCGFPCRECTKVLYAEGSVLHSDFEPILRDLLYDPARCIVGLARNVIDKSMRSEEYGHLRQLELQKLGKPNSLGWNFWKRK
jgi:hypothetical protein